MNDYYAIAKQFRTERYEVAGKSKNRAFSVRRKLPTGSASAARRHMKSFGNSTTRWRYEAAMLLPAA